MKRELMRINRLNYTHPQEGKLENISLFILEGECVGFIGLTYSGKDLLVKILSGSIDCEVFNNIYFFHKKQLFHQKECKKYIYRICPANYIIGDWNVAEYLCLVKSKKSRFCLRKGEMEKEAEKYLEELSLPVHVSKKLSQLTEIEKRMIDFAKACYQGAKIVIIEDEFEGMSYDEIKMFGQIIHRLAQGKIGVIVNSHSNFVLTTLSDKYVIFNEGRIVKKCKKNDFCSENQLNQFLFGDQVEENVEKKEGKLNKRKHKEVVGYCVKNLELGKGRIVEFNLKKGEIVTIVSHDKMQKDRIFNALSGREKVGNTSYIINEKKYKTVDYYKLAEERIVSVKVLGSLEETFKYMSVEENLLLPSLKKISAFDYIKFENKIRETFAAEIDHDRQLKGICAKDLKENELIELVLARWYIFNPKVIVLLEPFGLCDVNGVSIIKKYIKKFSAKGTMVIVISARSEYMEGISDRIIDIDFKD